MKRFIPLGSDSLGEPRVLVEDCGQTIVLDCFFPGCLLVDHPREVAGEWMPFQQLTIPLTGSLCESGRPQLPTLGRYLRIPPGCNYEVRTATAQEVSQGPVLVWPAQMEISNGRDGNHVFEFDEDLYSSSAPYPQNIVQVRGPCRIGGIPSLLVHVTPFQYIPAEQQLLGFGSIQVSIELRPRQAAPRVDATTASGARAVRGRLFFNAHGSPEATLDFPGARGFADAPDTEFLIIHSDPLKDAAQKLALWKSSRGLMTRTESRSVAGDTIEALKSHIRSLKEPASSRLRYVLLFGDTCSIPSEGIDDDRYDNNITDYYYSTEEDPEDINNDEYIFPWLAIGRIPVSNPVDAMNIVDKVIAYEKNPPNDPHYYNRILFAAHFEDVPVQDRHEDRGCIETVECIRKSLELLGYVGNRVYVTNNMAPQLYYRDSTPVPSEVRQEMFSILHRDSKAAATQALIAATSRGQLIICHRGHGSWKGWSSPPFEKSHLNRAAGDVPSVFYSIECDTGCFDHPLECFAQNSLKMAGGAVSVIASTRESNYLLNNLLLKGLFDATFPNVLPNYQENQGAAVPIRRLGDILNYAKAYLPLDASSNGVMYIRDHFEIYHVIGDPTLEIWTECPRMLTVEARIESNSLEILLSNCPAGSVLTIWLGEQMLKRLEPSSTRLSIPVELLSVERGDSLSELRICCWAPGYRFCEIRVNLEGL